MFAGAWNLTGWAGGLSEGLGVCLPDSEVNLLKLRGSACYTSSAVAARGFGRRAVVVDGNVERVVARLFQVETPLPAAKPELHRLAGSLTPAERAGDFAQAMMDLGATACLPRNPKCLLCPLEAACRARAAG